MLGFKVVEVLLSVLDLESFDFLSVQTQVATDLLSEDARPTILFSILMHSLLLLNTSFSLLQLLCLVSRRCILIMLHKVQSTLQCLLDRLLPLQHRFFKLLFKSVLLDVRVFDGFDTVGDGAVTHFFIKQGTAEIQLTELQILHILLV